MSSPAFLPNKKVYKVPRLTVYGSLTEMTRANTNVGHKDGGANNTKTG